MILIVFVSINVALYQYDVMGESITTVQVDITQLQTTEKPFHSTTVHTELDSTKIPGGVDESTTAKEATSLMTSNISDFEVSTEGVKTTEGTHEFGTTEAIIGVNDSTVTAEATLSLNATTMPNFEAFTQAYNPSTEVEAFDRTTESKNERTTVAIEATSSLIATNLNLNVSIQDATTTEDTTQDGLSNTHTSAKLPEVKTTEVTLIVPTEPTHVKINVSEGEFDMTLDIASFYKINTSFVHWEPSENKKDVIVYMIDYFNLSERIFENHKKAVVEGLETYPNISLWNATLTKVGSIDMPILHFLLSRVGPNVIVPWEELNKGVAILLETDLNKILDKIKQVGVKDTFIPAYCKEPFDKFSRLWSHVTKFLIAIKVYAYSIICVLGIIGNLLSFTVLSKDKINTSVFTLKVLALVDTVHLVLRAVTEPYFVAYSYTNWINKTLDTNVSHEYAIATIYMRPVVDMAQMASAWAVVYLTLDRFIAICFPFKAINFCTIKVARFGVSAVVCFSVLYNIPAFFSMIHTWSEHTCLNTWMVFRYLSEFGRNWYYRIIYEFALNLIFRTFGPVLLVFILNVKLVHELRASRKRREEISSQPSATTENKDRNITVTLIVISFVFLICIIPMVGQKIFDIIVYVVLDVKVNEGMAVELILSEYSHIYEASGIYGAVVDLLLIVNSAINIIIYCLVRREFASKLLFLFCPCRAKKDTSIVSHTASSKLGSRSYSDSPL